jgi:hypothetical protein
MPGIQHGPFTIGSSLVRGLLLCCDLGLHSEQCCFTFTTFNLEQSQVVGRRSLLAFLLISAYGALAFLLCLVFLRLLGSFLTGVRGHSGRTLFFRVLSYE